MVEVVILSTTNRFACESVCGVEGSLPASSAVGLARNFYQHPSVDFARVEQTPLTVAFDLDVDSDRTSSEGVPDFSRPLRESLP